MAKQLLSIFVAIILMVSSKTAQAEAPHACTFLLELENLPIVLSEARAGNIEVSKVAASIKTARQELLHNKLRSKFSAEELKQIDDQIRTIKTNLMIYANPDKGTEINASRSTRIGIGNLVDRYGCMAGTVELAEVSAFGSIIDSGTNKTALRVGSGDRPESDTVEQLMNSNTNLLVFASLFCGLVVLIFWAYTHFAKREPKQSCCDAGVLLTWGNNCSVTKISLISSHSARLQAPVDAIPDENIVLHVAGQKIPATQDWLDKFFLGVKFDNPIADSVVLDIVASSREKDQLSNIGKNATECYFPGCHTQCGKHRITKIQHKYANIKHTKNLEGNGTR